MDGRRWRVQLRTKWQCRLIHPKDWVDVRQKYLFENDPNHEWSSSMNTRNLSWTGTTAFLLMCALPISANALPPELQTAAPVIYLADNLDERSNLGWCIDTVGRGFGDQLQAHL